MVRPLALLIFVSGCATEGAVPLDADTVRTEDGLYDLLLEPDPDPPATGPASLRVSATLAGTEDPVLDATLEVEPWMPAHGHGVMGELSVEPLGESVWSAEWTWPMPGYWEVTLTVDTPEGSDQAVVAWEVQ